MLTMLCDCFLQNHTWALDDDEESDADEADDEEADADEADDEEAEDEEADGEESVDEDEGITLRSLISDSPVAGCSGVVCGSSSESPAYANGIDTLSSKDSDSVCTKAATHKHCCGKAVI